MADVLQVHFALNLLPEIIIRDQFICFIPQSEMQRWFFDFEADAKLFHHIFDRKSWVDPSPNGYSVCCRDVVRRDQAGFGLPGKICHE